MLSSGSVVGTMIAFIHDKGVICYRSIVLNNGYYTPFGPLVFAFLAIFLVFIFPSNALGEILAADLHCFLHVAYNQCSWNE